MSRPPKNPLDKAHAREIEWAKVAPVFEAMRPIGNPSFVYFIGEQDDGPVKIGVAKDPVARLRGMQTGNPRRLRVERVLIGDRELEQLLHQMWRELAIVSPTRASNPDASPGTEWFEPGIRERLFQVVDTAAKAQVEYVTGSDDEIIDLNAFERIVREAHGAHDVTAVRPHEVRLLAAGAGYVTPRRSSRI